MQSLKHKNTKKSKKRIIVKDSLNTEEDKGSNRLKPNIREEEKGKI